MKIDRISVFGMFVAASAAVSAQSVTSADDALGRGYYNRPYARYEAEPGMCGGNASFLMPPVPYTQQPLQAEASNLIAAQLLHAGDRVEWTCDKGGDGLTVRFSLPDSDDGKGHRMALSLYVGTAKLADIQLDSFWAWQYTSIANTPQKSPDNTPAEGKFARMRFDEVYVLLPRAIAAGERFALVREDGGDLPCTIDFVELEQVAPARQASDIAGDKVVYTGDGSTLQSVINANPGKTIYLPEGDYNIPRRLTITADNTRIIGAGMWHTRLYFSASADNRRTYANRGIETNRNGIVLEGFSVNTANNMRYYENDESKGVGKGLMGSFGRGSTVRDVRIDHFECGAWIADYAGNPCDGLTVEHCRFRNNYADGINLCSGTGNATVRYCSFRNNGDDDMASWSTGNLTHDNEFAHCTAENNWRASSLGFFGGRNNRGHHLVIADAMESGMRATADFQGTGFATEGSIGMTDISIYRSGSKAGTPGTQGGFWGAACPSVCLQAGYWYDLNNITVERVDIYGSRYRGVSVSANAKRVNNLELHDITVNGVDGNEWGIYYASNLQGTGHYSNLVCNDISEPAISNIPVRFDFTERKSAIDAVTAAGTVSVKAVHGAISVCGAMAGDRVAVYAANSVLMACAVAGDAGEELTIPVPPGLYIVVGGNFGSKVMVK